MHRLERQKIMDIYDTDFDPLATLLELCHKVEQLEDMQNRLITVINNQTDVIKTQAQFIDQIYKKLQLLEERTQ